MAKHKIVGNLCRDVQAQLSVYADAELPDEQMKMIRLHLDECPQCQKQYDELLDLWSALADLTPVHAPANFEERVMELIDKRGMQNIQQPVGLWRLLAVSVAAAVLGVIVGGWMGMAILDKEAVNGIERSVSSTLDVFAPAPKGTFAEGYFAMLHNSESR